MAAGIDASGLGKLLVCFEDITGRDLWPKVQEALAVRLPLSDLTFENKFKKLVYVDQLDIEFLPMKHQRIQRLRQHQNNPTSWFRLPYCHVIVVTAMESADYKATVRSKLNVMVNGPRGTLETLCETLIVYIRPPEADPQAKGPKKVFDKLRDDFNPKKGGERCVRLDLYDATQLKDAQGMIIGLDALEATIKDCIRIAFQTRQTAYDEEARKLMSHRMDLRVNFGTLFLVKDSLALMLESVRLLEDALREYFELEAACLEALEEGGSLNGHPFGGDEKGDDVAVLMSATWKSIHQSVHANKPLKEFKLRQYLFSAKARLLFHLNRPTEVVDRGLKFIQDFTKLISERESEAGLHPSFREIWAFSACLSVASTAAKFYTSHDQEMQHKPGNWFGQQDAAEKARIQLSEVDWDVGVCGLEDVTADLDFDSLGGHFKRTAHRLRDNGRCDVRHWHFYSSLGHLYASAREELRRIFDAIYGAPETESEGLGGFHADMLPSFTPVCLSASRMASVDSSRRLSLSVQKTSNLIETLQRRVSGRRLVSHHGGMSVGSEILFSVDGEGIPSWMTRAGLANTPNHSRRNTVTQIQTPLAESPRGSVGSFVSVETEDDEQTGERDDAGSVISYDTSMTPMTSSQLDDGGNLLLQSVAGSSFYAGSVAPPSESAFSSLDQPLARTVSRKDTTSPRSLTSHVLGGSAYLPEASSGSCQGIAMPSLVVPDKLNWVVDWRIRRALASEELYEDLFVELTLAAAWCYARCGRLRTSALLRVDVAPLLLNHGLVSAAQQLYHMKSDMYLREGWSVLSAHVLPQLSACLRGDDPKRLMSTCLTYLSLQEECIDDGEVKKMMTDFENCAKELGEVDAASQSTLVAAPALQISPRRKCCSELFESKEHQPSPSLSPVAIARPMDGGDEHDEEIGALLLHAGDVAHLEVEVHSRLPDVIELKNVAVCLTIVGEDSISGARTMTSMVDGSLIPSNNTTPPSKQTKREARPYRTHSIQDFPTEKIQKSALQLFCSIDEEAADVKEGVKIHPGVTRIRFQCCPVREGFYALLFLTGEYFGTTLCLPLVSESDTVCPSWVHSPYKKKHNLTDAVEYVKRYLRESVVLQVEPASQRMEVSAALPQGCFVLGQEQWMGIVLKGKHSSDMQSGSLALSFTNHSDSIRLPTTAHITNKGIDDDEGIDAWVTVEDGMITLPPGFLYRGSLVVWFLMDLTPMPLLMNRMSSDMSRLERALDFDRLQESATGQESMLQLQTQLEYFSGCWRSHASLVNIPISNPFSFESNFIKMNSTSMLVTVRLASQLPLVADIESVHLELFCPRKQNCRPALIGPLFPTQLHPTEVVSIAFRLTKNEAKVLAACARESEEQLVSGEFSMMYRTDLYAKHKPLRSSRKNEALSGVRFPPSQDGTETSSEQMCSFKCPLELDVLMGGEGPKNDLFKITLLPPPAITSGIPVALTWMLERLGSIHSKEQITYEILPEAGWQACVPLNGSVFVPLTAAATLEAMFIAVSEGELQAPRLVLTQNKIQSPLVFLKVTADENHNERNQPGGC